MDTIFQPGPPGNPRVLDTTKSSITLAWNKPVYDGGSEITGYIVETCLPEEDEWTIQTPKKGWTATSFTIINLKENQEYKINICAINCEGVGEPAAVPGAPKAEDRLLPPEIELGADLRKVVSIRACGTLRLFVPIKGRPAPEVKWLREHNESLDKANIEITSSFTTLQVDNVDRFDAGKYLVTVENASGSKTAFVNVRVLDTPGAPQNLTIREITRDSVSLVWDAPLIDGGSRVRSYIVEKRESTRKAYSTVCASCHKSSWKVGDLEEGKLYFFRILAENEFGIGLPVETVEPVKASEKPLPPGKVSLGEVTGSSVTLTWEKPEHDGGSRITGYIVEMQSKDREKWTQVMVVKTNEAVVTGLTQGEEYMFRISATNEKGVSDPRPLSMPVVAKDLVIPPTFKLIFTTFSVMAGDDMKIDLPYAACPKATASWLKDGAVLKETTRVNSEATDKNLLLVIKEACRDDVGTYTIKLSNSAGEASTDINVWTPPEYDGGSLVTGYVVEKRDLPEGKWMKASFANVMENEFTVTGLIEDSKYDFRVIARNAAGAVSKPSMSTGPITAKDEVDPPTCETDPIYNQTIVVNAGETFNLEATVDGKPVPTAQWFKGNVEVENSARAEIKNTDFKALLVVKDSIRVDGGQYTLVLTNVGGTKTVPFSVKVLDRPGPSEGPLTVSNVTEEKCSLSWLPPKHDGGGNVSHYVIEKRETSRLAWTVVSADCGATMTKVTKLLKGNEYVFRVMAVNKYGVGEPLESTAVIMRNPFGLPGSPSELEITNIIRDSMTVCWNRPESTGGSEISGYIIEKRDRAGVRWTKCNKRRVTDLRFRVTGLTEDHEYEFRVSAENAAGVGQPSPATVYYKACDPTFEPGSPTNVHVVDTTKNSVTLAWSKPIYDGGCEIQGYSVEITKADEEEWTICTPPSGVNVCKFTITKLIEHQEYKVRICAINKLGLGEPSEIQGVVKPQDKINPPEIILDSELRKGIVVRAGGSMRICIPFKGRPTPEVSWAKEDGELPSKVQIETGEDYTQLSVDICDRFDAGKYIVKMENSAGVKSAFVSVRVLDTPGAPQSLIVKDVKRESVTLSWEPPLIDGGARITNYLVEKRESTRKVYSTVDMKCTKTSYRITGLTEGTVYYFRVLAENEFGVGQAVETEDSVKTAEPPLPVGKITLTEVTKTSASLSWEKPDHDGGSRIMGYYIEMQPVVKDCIRVDGGHFILKLVNVGGIKMVPVNVKVLDRPGPPDGPLEGSGQSINLPETNNQECH
uniref:Titin n=1 Tax=Cynoglossus semilaevis TaxID=244447 RepID=A0A3P8X5A8_CYNSE